LSYRLYRAEKSSTTCSGTNTFVFLPQAFDSCPRTLIEAQAAGCTIVTNSNAGRVDKRPLEEVMAAQAPKFWNWL